MLSATTQFLRVFVIAISLGLAVAPVRAENLTLTAEFLDSVNGFVDFARPVLGSGANAIPNHLAPGDTVFLAAQTRASLILINLTQGTAAALITVTNLGGPFVIDYPDPTPKTAGIGLWGVQHVRFRGTPGEGYVFGIKINRARSVGLKVDYNQFQDTRIGGEFRNSLDVELAQLEICHAGFAGIQAKYEITNARVPAGTTALLDGLHIHDCFIHDVAGEGMYLGWTSAGHPDIANVFVHDNRLERTGWDGIQLNLSHGTNEICRNTILGYGLTSNTYHETTKYFYQGSAFSISRLASFKLHHNYTQATGRYSANAVSYTFSDTSLIYDNVFILGAHGAPSPQPGIYLAQSSRTLAPGITVTIANNTILEPEHNGIQFSRADNRDDATGQPRDEGGVTAPVVLVNNLIVHPIAGDYVVPPALSTPTQTTNLFVDTLAAAGFVSPTDFHLAATSPAIDTGSAVPGVTTDFDDRPRPAGRAPDIGAFEFRPPSSAVSSAPMPIPALAAAASPDNSTRVQAGDFRRIYRPPDRLGAPWYINDHCFIRDDRGTWHLFGITQSEPAKPQQERFLAHAISLDLLAPQWTPAPDVLAVDAAAHETVIWAPFIVHHDSLYYLFYCAGGPDGPGRFRIHLATSSDLFHWTRHPANPLLLDGYDARDPMVVRLGDRWVLYYTATSTPTGGNHIVVAVTSDDLVHWGDRRVVFTHPKTGTYGGPTESPFVVERDGRYFLFLCKNAPYSSTAVYVSRDPFAWPIDSLVGEIPAHAAEVITAPDGRWWISRAGWGQGGVYLAELFWPTSSPTPVASN